VEKREYDSRYLEGIARFNRQEFFEAHQVWETVWLEVAGPTKDFYKGLIQVAIGLHHFRRGNTRGIRKLYFTSRRYLGEYVPVYMGLDVEKLLSDMDRCCSEVAHSEEHTPSGRLVPETIPEIRFAST